MAKVRVYELAKELGIESKVLVTKLQDMGEFVRSASSTVEAPVVRKLREAYPAAPAAARRTRCARQEDREEGSCRAASRRHPAGDRRGRRARGAVRAGGPAGPGRAGRPGCRRSVRRPRRRPTPEATGRRRAAPGAPPCRCPASRQQPVQLAGHPAWAARRRRVPARRPARGCRRPRWRRPAGGVPGAPRPGGPRPNPGMMPTRPAARWPGRVPVAGGRPAPGGRSRRSGWSRRRRRRRSSRLAGRPGGGGGGGAGGGGGGGYAGRPGGGGAAAVPVAAASAVVPAAVARGRGGGTAGAFGRPGGRPDAWPQEQEAAASRVRQHAGSVDRRRASPLAATARSSACPVARR